VNLGERRRRLVEARLCLVLEARPEGRDPADLLEAALGGGVDFVVLRDPEPTIEAAETFREATAFYDALLAVTDRPDVALACGADAVHAEELSVAAARQLAGSELLVGASIRAPADVLDPGGADYIFVGPVFETATKPDWEPVGLASVQLAAERCQVPFFAIGGIDVANAVEVVAAGAERIGVMRAIRDSDDPEAAARTLRALLGARAIPDT
jgi:thiamine-phosphate pyrophosphorylase